MTRLAFALSLALAAPAGAATLAEYTPGGSPCAGACTQPWAVAAFGVPDGDAMPMTIPRGSIIRHMSYAKGGAPMHERPATVMARDEPGIGYPLGDGRWMVRLQACMNWAVVSPPQRVAVVPYPISVAPAPRYAARVARVAGFGGGYTPIPPWVAPPAPEPPTAPVPIPAGGMLLALALAGLVMVRGMRLSQ